MVNRTTHSLHYSLARLNRFWWSGPGLNRQPSACKADALPIELPPRLRPLWKPGRHPSVLVGLGRVELPTSPLSGARSSQLSYRPSEIRAPGRLRRLPSSVRSDAVKERRAHWGLASQDQIVVRAGVEATLWAASDDHARRVRRFARGVDHEWFAPANGRNGTR